MFSDAANVLSFCDSSTNYLLFCKYSVNVGIMQTDYYSESYFFKWRHFKMKTFVLKRKIIMLYLNIPGKIPECQCFFCPSVCTLYTQLTLKENASDLSANDSVYVTDGLPC